jgi:phosphatidylserine/phosphatidylglycerophosphate/cardiolipin synthase-like enzyme
MKLIIQPDDGIEPVLSAIRNAKQSVEVAIFRFDRKDVEVALKTAAKSKGVRVTALIAFTNRGGETRLRNLEQRFLDAGIIVARSADDLLRYHGKYIIIDRRILYVLSFNFTHADVDHSRGFGIVTTHSRWVNEAVRLFKADCARTLYKTQSENFVVSPANSRRVLGAFIKRAKRQLLVYDPKISDPEMIRLLKDRAKAGVEIKMIGSHAGKAAFDVQKLSRCRLHTRTIIRDGRQAFLGSQSLRTAELDSRRELGVIVQDSKAVKKMIAVFDGDWNAGKAKPADRPAEKKQSKDDRTDKAVRVLTRELDPLAMTVKRAVRKAVAKAGEDVLHDEGVKDTMKKVVKQAVKEAVKEAVQEAREGE